MSNSVVVKIHEFLLETFDVKQLLEDPPKEKLSDIPPCNPKGGEIYIYSFTDTVKSSKFM